MPDTLLVIEDDIVFRKIVEHALGQEFTVSISGTLTAARAMLQESAPGCVLLDYQLPDGQGTTLIAELVSAHIPVVVCTACGSESIAVEALKQGADDYLVKGDLKRLGLRRAIDNAIERARLRAEIRARESEKDALITQLQAAFADIKTLEGLIPICASCKKVRDDSGFWQGVETYVQERTEASFSHGLCPICYEEEVQNIPKPK
jgi:DNA-binding NtrC family response regulator